jgi:hypothetical protein
MSNDSVGDKLASYKTPPRTRILKKKKKNDKGASPKKTPRFTSIEAGAA